MKTVEERRGELFRRREELIEPVILGTATQEQVDECAAIDSELGWMELLEMYPEYL